MSRPDYLPDWAEDFEFVPDHHAGSEGVYDGYFGQRASLKSPTRLTRLWVGPDGLFYGIAAGAHHGRLDPKDALAWAVKHLLLGGPL